MVVEKVETCFLSAGFLPCQGCEAPLSGQDLDRTKPCRKRGNDL